MVEAINTKVNTPAEVNAPAANQGFNPNTWNPWAFLVQFGIDNIQENIEGENVSANQMQVQENVLNAASEQYNDLMNKIIPSETPVKKDGIAWYSLWHKESKVQKEIDNNDLPAHLYKKLSSADMEKNQATEAQLNNQTTQANNNLSTAMKIGVENDSEKNTQIANMISTEIQDLSVMMTIQMR